MQGLPDSPTKVKAFTVALNTDKSQTFFTVLRDFHILETLREPKKMSLKMKKKKKKNNKNVGAGSTKLPGILALSIAGHIPLKMIQYIWFAIRGVANITTRVASTTVNQSPLTEADWELK